MKHLHTFGKIHVWLWSRNGRVEKWMDRLFLRQKSICRPGHPQRYRIPIRRITAPEGCGGRRAITVVMSSWTVIEVQPAYAYSWTPLGQVDKAVEDCHRRVDLRHAAATNAAGVHFAGWRRRSGVTRCDVWAGGGIVLRIGGGQRIMRDVPRGAACAVRRRCVRLCAVHGRVQYSILSIREAKGKRREAAGARRTGSRTPPSTSHTWNLVGW